MGCDFYTFYELCIEYIVDNKTRIENYPFYDTRESHYWNEILRDEDFEEMEDYWKRCDNEHYEQIQEILKYNYPRIDLCVDKTWKCLESAKAKYLTIASKLNITEESIVNVWKQGNFCIR